MYSTLIRIHTHTVMLAPTQICIIVSRDRRLRLSGKQDDSLERQSDSSESWSDILEYITHLTCSYGNDLDMYPATTCDCGRKFNSLRGTRINKARWCEERNSPAGECKSIDGPMSPVYPHSIHKPISDHNRVFFF